MALLQHVLHSATPPPSPRPSNAAPMTPAS
jgi:hypothetical protein